MSEPKKHHYLSQFYLSGFTKQNRNEGELFCYDINTKLVRSSKPINEGYVKHFNKIESNKDDPNVLEKELSKVESSVSDIFYYIHKNKKLPKDKKFSELIYYISLLGVRNPSIRETLREAEETVFSRVFDILFSDEKIWQSAMDKMSKNTDGKTSNITFEEMKKFYESKKWKLVEPNENKISIEFQSAELVYKLLMQRSWILLIIKDNLEWFVTSDRPVKLMWSEANALNFGPGFGMKNSELYFPLSKNMLLIGSYKLPPATIYITKEYVATYNSLQFLYTSRFIYSPTKEFIVNGKNQSIIKSSAI